MKPNIPPPTSLIGRCLRRCRGKELTKLLRGYAAEVVITARMTSPAAAGRILGLELTGEPFSPTPILNILALVESGDIPMTRERLKAVVDQDEAAIRFCAENPWIIDPAGRGAPPIKKGRKPKHLTPSETISTRKSQSTIPKKREPLAKKVSNPIAPKASEPPIIPPRMTAAELRDLTRREEENQRRPPERKPEPKPPVFRGTPPPPKGAKEEELETWRVKRKQEIADFIKEARRKGWEIPADWNGYESVAKVAKWIGTES